MLDWPTDAMRPEISRRRGRMNQNLKVAARVSHH